MKEGEGWLIVGAVVIILLVLYLRKRRTEREREERFKGETGRIVRVRSVDWYPYCFRCLEG